VQAQKAAVNNQDIFSGAHTDELIDNFYRTSVHFLVSGLQAHAQQWYQQLTSVFIPNAPVAPTCVLSVDKNVVLVNDSFTLTWLSANADSMSEVANQAVLLPANGSEIITPTTPGIKTYSYTLQIRTMEQDNLYQKSVTAVFLLMIVGISLFFYSMYLTEQKRSAATEERNKKNLAALLEQTEATTTDMALQITPEYLEGIAEESPSLDPDLDPSQTQSSRELENLLKEFE
jgi:hypothetical protein